jgi:hypothetical protein
VNCKSPLASCVAASWVFALACGAAQLAPPPGRAVCYALADARAQARVDAECRGAQSAPDAGAPAAFADCPAHDSIMASLESDQAACK